MKTKGTFQTVLSMLDKKSPAILTGFAVAGLFTTAYLAYKSGPKIDKIRKNRKAALEKAKNEKEQKAIKQSAAKDIAVAVAPPIIMGITTAACIIGSNTVSSKRIATLSAAYTVSEAAIKDLNGKMNDILGEKKAKQIKDAIAKDKVDKNPKPVNANDIIITGGGEVLCMDAYSGRYFRSNAQKIQEAINKLSSDCMCEMYVSLNDFYEQLRIPPIPMGEDLGWSVDDMVHGVLPIVMSAVLTETNEPCLCVDYSTGIRPDFRNLH